MGENGEKVLESKRQPTHFGHKLFYTLDIGCEESDFLEKKSLFKIVHALIYFVLNVCLVWGLTRLTKWRNIDVLLKNLTQSYLNTLSFPD